MDNISIELYMIWYTLIWIVLLFLYSLPIRILTKVIKGVKWVFNNKNNKWKLL